MTRLTQVEGDVFAVSPHLPAEHYHGALVDPPYLWGFMGRAFDAQHRAQAGKTEAEKAVSWNLRWLQELHRVLVPGAYAAVFQGSKTYHRLAYAAELAGFEILPMLCGITGQAMAQGGAVGKLIDREAAAERVDLGPGPWAKVKAGGSGWVRCIGRYLDRAGGPPGGRTTAPATPLARDFEGHHSRLRDQLMPVAQLLKPPEDGLARNAARRGVAGLNTDGCRSPASAEDAANVASRLPVGFRRKNTQAYGDVSTDPKKVAHDISAGRFPGNVLLDAAAAEEVGDQSGWKHPPGTITPARARVGASYTGRGDPRPEPIVRNDTGTAARYFQRFKYVGRAPASERTRGLEHWHWIGDPDDPEGWRRLTTAEALVIPKRKRMTGSDHPTIKALELTGWIAQLILPPLGPEALRIRGGATRLLIPFSGVLSEAIGAARAGWPEIVAIESSASYAAQGAERFRAWGPYGKSGQASLW